MCSYQEIPIVLVIVTAVAGCAVGLIAKEFYKQMIEGKD